MVTRIPEFSQTLPETGLFSPVMILMSVVLPIRARVRASVRVRVKARVKASVRVRVKARVSQG